MIKSDKIRIMNVFSAFLFLLCFCSYSALPTLNLNSTRLIEDPPHFLKSAKNATSRVVGGTVAPEGSHPHMVGLIKGRIISYRICGGSLIGFRHILTAAHCVAGRHFNSIRAVVGTNKWNTGGHIYNISDGSIHEGYTEFITKNDIAILYTDTDVQYNELVKPIILNFGFVETGTSAKFAGWGNDIKIGGSGSKDLLEMSSNIVDGQHCVDIVSMSEPLAPPVWPDIEICAFQSFGVGICHGDSGSALVDIKTNRQIGIASWIMHCARGAPDVYVRISAYRDWINSRMVKVIL